MRIKCSFILLLAFLLFAGGEIYSQQTQPDQSLVEIINELQRKFDVQFNYASESVEGIKIKPPDDDWDLDRAINYLSEHTGLLFNRLANNIVTIKKAEAILCGYLLDKDSDEPVVFATIIAGNMSTVTNNEGYFELRDFAPGTMIQIRHVAYKILERDATLLQSDGCGKIYLIPDQQQLVEGIVQGIA